MAEERLSALATASEIKNTKIACSRKFFDEIGRHVSDDLIKYDVVTSYEKLMDIIGHAAT